MRVSSISPYNVINYGTIKKDTNKNEAAAAFGVQNNQNLNLYTSNPFSRDYFLGANNLSFKGYVCSPDDFKIKHAFGIECPCCGNVMLTKKQSNAFAKRIENATGFDLQRELTKYYGNFRQNEREIADILIERSKSNPDADLSELVELEAQNRLQYLETAQIGIIGEMHTMADELSEDKKNEVQGILSSEQDLIENSDDFKYFKRKAFIQRIDRARQTAKRKTDAKIMEEMLKKAERMPDSGSSKDAFFVKYARRKNEDIARRLVSPSIATTEHVKPQSKNGKNSTSNYIPLCAKCNSERGNMPYNDWFKIHPEMPSNLQKFVNTIYEMIQNQEFLGWEFYDTYVDDVIYAVQQETGGKLTLKNPTYEETKPESEETKKEPLPEKKPLTLDEQRDIWLNEYETRLHKIEELRELRSRLFADEEFQNIRNYCANKERIQSTKQERNAQHRSYMDAQSRVRSAKKAIIKAEKEQETDTDTQLKTNGSKKTGKDQRTQTDTAELKKRLKEAQIQLAEEKEKYNNLTNKLNALQAIESEILEKVTTPDDISNQIQRIKIRREQIVGELRIVDDKLPADTATVKDVGHLIQIGSRNSKSIQKLQNENREIESSTDMESPESIQAVEEYEELSRKLQMIKTADIRAFRRAFDFEQTYPDFILDIARKNISSQIQSLLDKKPAARHRKNSDTIAQYEQKAGNIARKIELQKEYNDIERKLDELQKRKAAIVKKFNNINIEDTINSLQQEADKILTKYSESFETYGFEYNGNGQN